MSITQNIEFPAGSGATLTGYLFTPQTNTLIATSASCAEDVAPSSGRYVAAFTSTLGIPAGIYRFAGLDAGNNPFYGGHVEITAQGNGTWSVSDYGQTLIDADDKASYLLLYPQRTVIRGTVGAGSSTSAIVTSALDISGTNATQLNGRVLLFDKTTATAALQGAGSPIVAITTGATPTITLKNALPASAAAGDTFGIY